MPALVCLLAVCFGLVNAFASPALAAFTVNGISYNTDSGTKIKNQGVGGTALNIDQAGPGSFNMSFFRAGKKVGLDTDYATVTSTETRVVAPIYGDTLTLLRGDSIVLIPGNGTYDTIYLTSDTAGIGETLTYDLYVTNHANARDVIGVVVDTIWINGSIAPIDTTGRFSYQFFDSTNVALTGILTKTHEDTARMGLTANRAETVQVRVYTTGTVNADTIRLGIRAMANNATGRHPRGTGENFAYKGFNGIRYGGNGNDATFVEVTVSGPLIYLAKTDTVFTHAVLAGGAADTQNYVPGALVVYTIWFDNDGTDTADTIVIEDWLDTRHLKFDSQGLSVLAGTSQNAASGSHVTRNYGNIYVDSAMPTFSTGFNVKLEYVNSAGAWTDLKTAPSAEAVGRIRWTISRAGGVVGASNGDDVTTVDTPPTAPTSTGDIDMGFVRFSAVIR